MKHKVKALGMPYERITEEFLHRKFCEYNLLYFEGKLPDCEVKINEIQRFGVWGWYYTNGNSDPIIEIDTLLTYDHDYQIRNVLIHEMIHLYIDKVLCKEEKPVHGYVFRRVRKELNETYHLYIDQNPHVSVYAYNIYKIETQPS